jgi:hypothetical protein
LIESNPQIGLSGLMSNYAAPPLLAHSRLVLAREGQRVDPCADVRPAAKVVDVSIVGDRELISRIPRAYGHIVTGKAELRGI